MPSARQPVSALRDRAERHVFEVLPGLGAMERRVLALLELAEADRVDAGRDTGLADEPLGVAAAHGRKALRRLRAPLASGARCERAELLHSDRLDLALDRHARKWLEIHLARCPRCIEHVELLEEARAELRAAFTAEPQVLLPPAPEPPALAEGAARLRLVPAEPETEPEPEATAPPEPEATPEPGATTPPEPEPAPAAKPVSDPPPAAKPVSDPPPEAIEWTVEPRSGAEVSTRRDEEPVEPVEPAVPDIPASPAPVPTVAPAPRRLAPSPAAKRTAKVLAILLVIAGMLAGIGAGLNAIEGEPQTAPWNRPDAPDVRPAPLTAQ